jgi:5-methylthioribose kinase
MKNDSIINELKERINEDLFDDLEEKLETLQLLADFESANASLSHGDGSATPTTL